MDKLKAANDWWDNMATDSRKISLWEWMTQPSTDDLQHPNQMDILKDLEKGQNQ